MAALPFIAQAVDIKRGGDNLLHRSNIEYPAAALENKIEGTVVIEARLDGKGIVRDARVVSGPDELRAASLKSVLDWHYSVEKGAPPIVEIAIDFKLGNKVRLTPLRPGSGTLKGIDIMPFNSDLKDKILAKLSIKVGDQVQADMQAQIIQTVRSFDEHLQVRFLPMSDGTRLQISMSTPIYVAPQAGGAEMPKQIRVGGNVQAVNILNKVTPVYPPDAKAARIQGVVRMNVIIAADGTMKDIQLESGHPMLVNSAMDAVRQWVYRPTLLNGVPVEVKTTIDVNYTLAP